MGGCGCGGKRKRTLTSSGYVLRDQRGETTEHRTRLEAEAEKVRRGGGTIREKRVSGSSG